MAITVDVGGVCEESNSGPSSCAPKPSSSQQLGKGWYDFPVWWLRLLENLIHGQG